MKNEKGKNIFKKLSKNASREVQKSKLGPWASQMEISTFIDLAEFIRQMAENIHILAEARFLVMVTLDFCQF